MIFCNESVVSIYSDILAHIQVVINCQFSVAQMCTQEDAHAHLFTRAILDDVLSQNELKTLGYIGFFNTQQY